MPKTNIDLYVDAKADVPIFKTTHVLLQLQDTAPQ
jgi:hypothetical protein